MNKQPEQELNSLRMKFNDLYPKGGLEHKGRLVQSEVFEFISEAISHAVVEERERIYKELKDFSCPEAYGYEGRETFPDCGECIICKAKLSITQKK